MDPAEIPTILGCIALTLLPAAGGAALLSATAVERGDLTIGPRAALVVRGAARFLAALPAAFFVGFAMLVVKARIDAGDWPSSTSLVFRPSESGLVFEYVGGPHPSAYDPARSILLVALVAGLVSIVLVPGLLALARASGRPVGRRPRTTYFVTWVALLALVVLDPGGFALWAFGD